MVPVTHSGGNKGKAGTDVVVVVVVVAAVVREVVVGVAARAGHVEKKILGGGGICLFRRSGRSRRVALLNSDC